MNKNILTLFAFTFVGISVLHSQKDIRPPIRLPKRIEVTPRQDVVDNTNKLLQTNECKKCDLKGAQLYHKTFSNVHLEKANLSSDIVFCTREMRLGKKCRPSIYTNLKSTTFTNAYLENAKFKEAKMQGTTIKSSDLSKANLRGARLNGATLEYVDFSEADFTFANLMDTTFKNCNFKKAKNVNFEKATEVTNCDFEDVKNVNLSGARKVSGNTGL